MLPIINYCQSLCLVLQNFILIRLQVRTMSPVDASSILEILQTNWSRQGYLVLDYVAPWTRNYCLQMQT